MAGRFTRGPRKAMIVTAVVILIAPIMVADTPTAGALSVYGALLMCIAWWGRYFFKRARARSRKTAIVYLERALEAREAGDFVSAMQWFTLSANCGDADAMNQVGLLHMNGLGVPKNNQLAAEWFKKAIANGETKSAPVNLQRAQAEMHGDRHQRQGGGPEFEGGMTRSAALEVFDLKEGAGAADIRAAYLRLMQQVHPDKGGSTFFAKQLNEARNLLLPAEGSNRLDPE